MTMNRNNNSSQQMKIPSHNESHSRFWGGEIKYSKKTETYRKSFLRLPDSLFFVLHAQLSLGWSDFVKDHTNKTILNAMPS